MENKVKTDSAWSLGTNLQPVTNAKLAVVKYDFPEDITEEQNEVLKIMMLNRIDSVITGCGFDRNTLTLVHDNMSLPIHDERQSMAEDYYRNERIVIDEMFTDVEDGKAYQSTLGDLARCQAKQFQVKQLTENQIFILLMN